ncbi:MAG: hypothetical protein JWO06_419 [Bacteroidota bacterium]|nr:hypothetical protein [Bacteroidota bacterium]
MSLSINDILSKTDHRPWPLPKGAFVYYQEWLRLLFFHFKVDIKTIAQLLPPGIEPDVFEDSAWISVVPFSMKNIRPRLLPSFPPISNFDEINVRTYVTDGKHSGVFFLNIEAGSSFSAWLAKSLSGLPYEKSAIHRNQLSSYTSLNPAKGFSLDVEYAIGNPTTQPEPFDLWLTERYRLYLTLNGQTFSYDIHHHPWPLQQVSFSKLNINYQWPGIQLTANNIVKAHYSPGVQVLAWARKAVSSF